MHLAVELPWEQAGAAPGFDTYVRLARTAERGVFDLVLLGEGLDPAGGAGGGPEPFTVLTALAGVTERIGLAAAVGTAGRDVDRLARRLDALDRLSGGRAAGPVLGSRPPGGAVTIGGEGAVEVLVLGDGASGASGVNGARERTPHGARVLVRLDITPADMPADPQVLADRLAARVDAGEVDGYVLVPAADPGGHGLDAFVGRVVLLLRDRGALPAAYRGATLRDHLGLAAHEPPIPVPVPEPASVAVAAAVTTPTPTTAVRKA